MIKVFATGYIGKDAEVRTVGDSTVTSFSIASTKKYKDKEETTWLNCQKWKAGKLSEYLKKGTKIAVGGELTIKEHEGKYYTTLNVFDVEFMSSPNATVKVDKPGGREDDGLPTDIPERDLPGEETEDLPF